MTRRLPTLVAIAIAAQAMPPLSCASYSGTSASRDPCCKGLVYLYNFGPSYGDATSTVGDDVANLLNLPSGSRFTFFGASYSSVHLNSNGLLSFGASVTSYTSQAFPITGNPVLAPFWVDVDLTGTVALVTGYPTTNRVWYRAAATPLAADVQRMTADVAASFPLNPAFVPTTVFVFTWFAVGRYNAKNDRLNTFQAALASDASGVSYVTFCYDNLLYDDGDASLGTHVNAGFNAGSGSNYYSLPGANTASDLTFACAGSNGCYTYRVDLVTIAQPSPSPTPSQSPTSTSSRTGTISASQTRSASLTSSPSETVSPSSTASLTQTPSATSTPSNSRTLTPSGTPTATVTPSGTLTRSATPTSTGSGSSSAAATPTSTQSPSSSQTPSQTPSPSRTPTQTRTGSVSQSPSLTSSLTQSPSTTSSRTQSQTPSATSTASSTETRTQTATATGSPSQSPTLTLTPSLTQSSSSSPTSSQTPTISSTPSQTLTGSVSQTASLTPSLTQSPSTTSSRTQTLTPSASSTPTSTETRTQTATVTGSPSQAQTSSATPTATQSTSATQTPSVSGTPTASQSRSASTTPTPSTSATPSASGSPSSTSSSSSTVTRSQRLTSTSSPSQSGSESSAPTPSPTATASSSGSGSATGTPSSSSTMTGSQTATPSASGTRTQSTSASVTATASRSGSASLSGSPSQVSTATQSSTPSASPTRSASGSPSPSPTPSLTSTQTRSMTSSPSLSLTPSPASTASVSATPTMTSTPSPARTPSPTPTASPSGTVSASWTATQSQSLSIGVEFCDNASSVNGSRLCAVAGSQGAGSGAGSSGAGPGPLLAGGVAAAALLLCCVLAVLYFALRRRRHRRKLHLEKCTFQSGTADELPAIASRYAAPASPVDLATASSSDADNADEEGDTIGGGEVEEVRMASANELPAAGAAPDVVVAAQTRPAPRFAAAAPPLELDYASLFSRIRGTMRSTPGAIPMRKLATGQPRAGPASPPTLAPSPEPSPAQGPSSPPPVSQPPTLGLPHVEVAASQACPAANDKLALSLATHRSSSPSAGSASGEERQEPSPSHLPQPPSAADAGKREPPRAAFERPAPERGEPPQRPKRERVWMPTGDLLHATPPLPSWQARRRELMGRLKDAVVRVPGARGERQAAAGGGRVLISAATAALLGLPHLPTPEVAAAPASTVPGTEGPVSATDGPPVEPDITAGGSEGGRPAARYTSRGGSGIAHSTEQTLVPTFSPLRVDARASAYPGVAPSSSLKAAEALETSASPGHLQRPRLLKVAGGAQSLASTASGAVWQPPTGDGDACAPFVVPENDGSEERSHLESGSRRVLSSSGAQLSPPLPPSLGALRAGRSDSSSALSPGGVFVGGADAAAEHRPPLRLFEVGSAEAAAASPVNFPPSGGPRVLQGTHSLPDLRLRLAGSRSLGPMRSPLAAASARPQRGIGPSPPAGGAVVVRVGADAPAPPPAASKPAAPPPAASAGPGAKSWVGVWRPTGDNLHATPSLPGWREKLEGARDRARAATVVVPAAHAHARPGGGSVAVNTAALARLLQE